MANRRLGYLRGVLCLHCPQGSPGGLSSSSCQADLLPHLISAHTLYVSLGCSPDKVFALEFLPWGLLWGKLGTPWTQEGWNESQSQGSEGPEAQSTYSIRLRTFHLPLTLMKESEMEKCRPWLGRGFRAEPSSSQLWMFRLERDPQKRYQPGGRGRSSLSRGLALAPILRGLDQLSLHQTGFWLPTRTCCVPCADQAAMPSTLHALCQFVSQRGSALFRFPFTEGDIEPLRRDAFAQSCTVRIRAHVPLAGILSRVHRCTPSSLSSTPPGGGIRFRRGRRQPQEETQKG